jgi:predicted O-linked N-acetylglucosamine transferase (SPINDLY family)
MTAPQLAGARATLRSRLGLAIDAPVFLCSQALFKILPDDDTLFARVLEAVPNATLLLFEGSHREVSAQTMRRLGSTLSGRGIAVRERVRMLSRMPRADFLHVNAACDALLDTRGWSGGNTSLDAFASGLPVVTLPGELMRARQTAAMLAIAGAPELIAATADDYVQLAARLATDAGWKEQMSAKIREGSGRLFDDPAPLAALAQFIRDARSRGLQSAPAPSGG